MILRSRFVQIRKHPPLTPPLEKHGICRTYVLHNDGPQLPFQGEVGATVDSDLPRFARLGAHVKRPLVLEQEWERHVERFFDRGSKFDRPRSGDPQGGDTSLIPPVYKT